MLWTHHGYIFWLKKLKKKTKKKTACTDETAGGAAFIALKV